VAPAHKTAGRAGHARWQVVPLGRRLAVVVEHLNEHGGAEVDLADGSVLHQLPFQARHPGGGLAAGCCQPPDI